MITSSAVLFFGPRCIETGWSRSSPSPRETADPEQPPDDRDGGQKDHPELNAGDLREDINEFVAASTVELECPSYFLRRCRSPTDGHPNGHRAEDESGEEREDEIRIPVGESERGDDRAGLW